MKWGAALSIAAVFGTVVGCSQPNPAAVPDPASVATSPLVTPGTSAVTSIESPAAATTVPSSVATASTSQSTDVESVANGASGLEAVVERYIEADRTSDAQTMFDLLSEECKQRMDLTESRLDLDYRQEILEDVFGLTAKDLAVEGPVISMSGSNQAEVAYFFVGPTGDPAYGPGEVQYQTWILELDGSWRRDLCNEVIGMDDELDPIEDVPIDPTVGLVDNPAPLGQTLDVGEGWTLTVNWVKFAATDEVLAVKPENDPPDDGNEYVIVNVTEGYNGPAESSGDGVDVEFVTPTGEVVATAIYDYAMPPQPVLYPSEPLLQNGAVSGNILFEVPSSLAGSLLISGRPGIGTFTKDNRFFSAS